MKVPDSILVLLVTAAAAGAVATTGAALQHATGDHESLAATPPTSQPAPQPVPRDPCPACGMG